MISDFFIFDLSDVWGFTFSPLLYDSQARKINAKIIPRNEKKPHSLLNRVS